VIWDRRISDRSMVDMATSKTAMIFTVVWCWAGGLNLTAGQTAEHLDADFIAKEWERKSAAVESLQVVSLLYVSPSDAKAHGLGEAVKDAPPIVPTLNKTSFSLLIYHKAGIKEDLKQWLFDGNALAGELRYTKEEQKVAPHLPFIVCQYPTRQVYEALKRGEGTVSLTREPSGAKQKVMVTTLWSSVEGKPPSARMTTILDPALGYAPVECRVHLLFPDGDRLSELHRWSRHVQVLKDLWLPQEHELNAFSSGGKVIKGRNKNIILSWLVNCRIPDSVFE
jgi:hypothetical protein